MSAITVGAGPPAMIRVQQPQDGERASSNRSFIRQIHTASSVVYIEYLAGHGTSMTVYLPTHKLRSKKF